MTSSKSAWAISVLFAAALLVAASLSMGQGACNGNKVNVPDCIGETQAAATAAIASAQLVLGSVTEQFSDTVAAGVVISHDPGAGASVSPGTAVNLLVSKGPAPNLTVDTNSVELSASSASTPVTVSNAGGGTLVWTAISNNPGVTVNPVTFTGNSQVMTITATDFTSSYTALVAVTNDNDGSDFELVDVSVSPVAPRPMVSIAAGSFQMGDPWGVVPSIEIPVHTVTLSAYQIGMYEVTNREYADVLNWAIGQAYLTTASPDTAAAFGQQLLDVNGTGSQINYSGGRFWVQSRDGYSMADHPVVWVTWYGAAAYCNWLSEIEGLQACYNTTTWVCDFTKNGYHLPTEAQWERAAAWAPTTVLGGSYHYRYGNGSDTIGCGSANCATGPNYPDDACNPLGLTSIPYTTPVGYYPNAASPAGCYDMAGNVHERCNDWWRREYSATPVTDPTGPPPATQRIRRGGHWGASATYCRSAFRDATTPALSYESDGFRLARNP